MAIAESRIDGSRLGHGLRLSRFARLFADSGRAAEYNFNHHKVRSLAEEGAGESSRLFYGADMSGDAHIHMNAILAEANAITPIHLGDGMSAGIPVKNVEASSPVTTRQARSNAPQRLHTYKVKKSRHSRLFCRGSSAVRTYFLAASFISIGTNRSGLEARFTILSEYSSL